MPDNDKLVEFIKDTFQSVWALELLLHLKRRQDQAWRIPDLVRDLRSSDYIVSTAGKSLEAAGLIISDNLSYQFRPATEDLTTLVEAIETLYAKSPDAVRRIIILSSNTSLKAFSNAFKLRKD